MNTMTPSKTFRVPAENLDLLTSQIELLNKRVDRLQKKGHNVAKVEITVGKLYSLTLPCQKQERIFADVELLSPKTPKVDGWEFVAALTHVDGIGSVLRVCPGATVSEGELAKYRKASPDNCDHCHTSRKRNDTFVIRNREGSLCQVGRQCLAAYTGLANPMVLCANAEILFAVSELLGDSEDDDFGGGCSGGERFVTINVYLPFVCCSIRQDGWLSRTAAWDRGQRGQSTCDLAFSNGVYAKLDNKDRYQPTEKDYNLAAAVMEFCEQHFADCEVEALTDYENSLRVAMASGIAHPKFAGLVASAVGFYQRDIERRAKNETWSKMVSSSRFQGTVGERGQFEGLKVLAYRSWPTDWGAKHFYSFMDDAGNAYVYFATRDMDLSVGQVVSLRGTVKKHEMYSPKGLRPEFNPSLSYAQTQLSRCALITRAKVVKVEAEQEWYGKLSAPNPQTLTQEKIMEKCHDYHLEGSDGRRYVYRSKSKKKGVTAGSMAIVSYDQNPVAQPSGEYPVSIVASC